LRALIIDDEPSIRLLLGRFLTQRGYEVREADCGSDGLTMARELLPDLVFLDQRLPDVNGDELLPYLVAPEIAACVVLMTAYVELDKAIMAMKSGAEYYFPKPLDLEQIALILDRLEMQFMLQGEASHYRQLSGKSASEGEIIGESPQIIRVQRLIGLLAKNIGTPALILGESGSGKELVTRAIHNQSGVSGPLVEINCASLSENLLESELFGHEKGAFTDAKQTKSGLFEIASEGTIFFDELAEMPLPIQAKLLKVLDTKSFRRVGGIVDHRSNARFIAATNRDLTKQVKRGAFREDLYYRINVLPITVPPLRDRGRDIAILAHYFVKTLGERMGKGRLKISPAAMGQLENFHWPGNVRELRNVIERALILSGGREILSEHLPAEIRNAPGFNAMPLADRKLRPLRQIEDDYIDYVLQATLQNHSHAAAALGISRSTLLAKLKKRTPGVQ
jgi:DNA-binding NtrC family response regulator